MRNWPPGPLSTGRRRVTLFNTAILRAGGLSEADFTGRIEVLKREIEARRARYLPGRAPVPVAGRTAIIVDDGIATGATVRVAIRALRAQGAGGDLGRGAGGAGGHGAPSFRPRPTG